MYAATRDVQTLPSMKQFAEGMEQHSNYAATRVVIVLGGSGVGLVQK